MKILNNINKSTNQNPITIINNNYNLLNEKSYNHIIAIKIRVFLFYLCKLS